MLYVGQEVRRGDGVEKVNGSAKFIDDYKIPDMWHGVVVRSTSPSGRVIGFDFDSSFDWSKVVVATASDIPGKNAVSMIEDDLPLLADPVFKHVGEGLLLIAAPTRELAQKAKSSVKVRFEEFKPTLTIEDSKKKKWVLSHHEINKGDLKKGFKEADRIIEREYSVGHQEHIYVETQGAIAIPRDDGVMEIIGSLQCPFYVSNALKEIFNWPENRFSVRQSIIGGAFGGKEDYPSIICGYAALLAYKCKHPVKIIYDRTEDIISTTKRHPAIIKYKTGVDKNGLISALDITLEMDGGAYLTLSPVVLSRAAIHAPGPYRIPNVSVDATTFATNTPPNGAFRGFGAPQAIFALESNMDEVAFEMGISPDEFRRKNALIIGDTTSTGQRLKESIAVLDVLEEAMSSSQFVNKYSDDSKWKKESSKMRGIGFSLFFHGGGFTGSGEEKLKSRAGIRIEDDGGITILSAQTEMGQGSHTVFSQIVAHTLHIPIDHVHVCVPDTAVVPNSGPTVASRSTMVVGKVLLDAALRLKGEIDRFAAGKFSARLSDLEWRGGRLFVCGDEKSSFRELSSQYMKEKGVTDFIEQYILPEGHHWDDEKYCGDAYPAYSWGCYVAELEVDKDTLEINLLDLHLVQDVGTVVNPVLARGQVEGGAVQGLGWALLEDFKMKDGKVLTDRLQKYIVPTSLDVPRLNVKFVEHPYSKGPYGAKGLGELPLDGIAPAIANAVFNACGIRIRDLPIRPEKLL